MSSPVRARRPFLALSEDAFDRLGLEDGVEYELARARSGIWVLVAAGAAPKERADTARAGAASPGKGQGLSALERRVLARLAARTLADRAEGRFERFLSGDEKKAFQRLLEAGRVKRVARGRGRATYQPAPPASTSSEPARDGASSAPARGPVPQGAALPAPPAAPAGAAVASPSRPAAGASGAGRAGPARQPVYEHTLERDGFQVVRGDAAARALCEQWREAIQRKEVLGVRSFNGNYYVMRKEAFQRLRRPVLAFIAGREAAALAEVARAVGAQEPLVQGVCELLREEGELVEKRREVYAYVG